MAVQIEMDDAGRAILQLVQTKLKDVYTGLGKGYPECVYQKAFGVELQASQIPYDLEVTMSIPYKGHVVGQVRADIILRGETPVVIETKATANALKGEEVWQLSRYLKIQDISLGCLVNFPQSATATEPQIIFLVLLEDGVYIYDLESGDVEKF